MKTLIVIDMQNDFIDGALGTPEAVAIVPRGVKKVKEYKERGDEVIFTRDTHSRDYLQTQEGQKLPVEHCIKYTQGWEICDELLDYTYEMLHPTREFDVLNKYAFGYPYWHRWLNVDTDHEIEIVGLCSDICVVSNALILKATFPETKITVDASCCAGTTPENHKAALQVMKCCQINVVGE